METLLNLGLEIISELVGIGIITLYVLNQKRIENNKLKKIEHELELEKLNNSQIDEVLLIDDIKFLEEEQGMEKFQRASVVLLKDTLGFYNIVVKNNYGNSGKIK